MRTINIPFCNINQDGVIVPNPLFHRAFNKMHSRCIEYPFASLHIDSNEYLLDLGSAQADPFWIQFLEKYSTHCVLSDVIPLQHSSSLPFFQSDCRNLPFEDNTFDCITAISFIEHIGLHSPQTLGIVETAYSEQGDIETLIECRRVLKPGGKLILTIPFGVRSGLSACGTARLYAKRDIARFQNIFFNTLLEYYEYCLISKNGFASAPIASKSLVGKATWCRKPYSEALAQNETNMDGVLCSLWIKEGQ